MKKNIERDFNYSIRNVIYLLLLLLLLLLMIKESEGRGGGSSSSSGGTMGGAFGGGGGSSVEGSSSSCQTVCACKWKGGKQTVECIDRSLISIPDNIDSNTQVLDMSGNNLQILPRDTFIRAGLLNLQKVYLRNCRLGQIDNDAFKGLTNLVELDLSHNLLTAIPSTKTLAHIPSLRELSLSSNPIQKVESNSFHSIHSLNKLDLSHCDIQTIAQSAFHDLNALHSLKLNGNKLTDLKPHTIESLSKLHGVELHDNPWFCDCHLRTAKIWLTENNIPNPVPPVCSGGPERVIDRTFSELTIDDFACRPEIMPSNRFIEATTGENATILCRISAIPTATINWYWNGRLLINGSAFSAYQKVFIHEIGEIDKKSRLILTNAQETDSSEFYCVADNRAGSAETNFTLHVAMRTAGMASLGSGQIVGLTAILAIIILTILLVTLFLLVRLKRIPFSDSKTPGGNGGGLGGANAGATSAGSIGGGGDRGNHLENLTNLNSTTTQQANNLNHTTGIMMNNDLNEFNSSSVDYHHKKCPNELNLKKSTMATTTMAATPITAAPTAGTTNPLQKPPRLTDITYSTSHYDGNGSIISTTAGTMYISPTASAGNNPDLINDTKRLGSDDLMAALCNTDALLQSKLLEPIDRPGSGEYSRAGGCDSLYPSGLWSGGNENHHHHQQQQHQQQLYHHHHQQQQQLTSLNEDSSNNLLQSNQHTQQQQQDLYLKRATNSMMSVYNYTEKTPIIDSTSHTMNLDDEHSSAEFMSRTFPRTVITPHQFTTAGGSGGSLSGIGIGLGGNIGSSGKLHQFNSNSGICGSSSGSGTGGTGGGYPSDYGLPLVPGAEHLKTNSILPPAGMPNNAKTLRVWQRGGVPVLPPVSALKRALTSSRNSPDEGYQEGCGTDV